VATDTIARERGLSELGGLLATHPRSRDVPRLAGLSVSACRKCSRWFNRPRSFQLCYECCSGRAKYASAVEAAQRAVQSRTEPSKPKGSQRLLNGIPLGRALALVKAIQLDCPNVRKGDLKPEWRECWA
jgi:hypothetical protein